MKLKIRIDKEEVEVPDVIKCGEMGKFSGLMFKEARKANAVLFEFGRPTMQAIHSFFCPHFIAVWLDDGGNILEWRKISERKASIMPNCEFSKLLEIPLNNKYSAVVKFLSRTERFK
jgi:hypothetical protein